MIAKTNPLSRTAVTKYYPNSLIPKLNSVAANVTSSSVLGQSVAVTTPEPEPEPQPSQTPTVTPPKPTSVPKVPTPSPKPKSCFLWWCW